MLETGIAKRTLPVPILMALPDRMHTWHYEGALVEQIWIIGTILFLKSKFQEVTMNIIAFYVESLMIVFSKNIRRIKNSTINHLWVTVNNVMILSLTTHTPVLTESS